MAVLEQNPGTAWPNLLDGVDVAPDTGGGADQIVEADGGDEFASFKI